MIVVNSKNIGETGDLERGETTRTVSVASEPSLDEERLLGLEPYEVIVNPTVGQEYRLLERGFDADGAFVRAEIRYQADATSFAEHVHPKQAETFSVLSGELLVTVAGDEQSLGPGTHATLPAGVPHTHRNASGVETHVLWEVRPPLEAEAFLRALATLARDGQTDAKGTPNLLALAVFLDANPESVYLSSPPIVVQKLLFKLLAPIGRRRGYSADYPATDPNESL